MTLTQPSAATRPAAEGPGDSLATGAAGVALLHIELARTGAGTWATAHEQVTAMTRDPVTAHPGTASLYRGAPAVAFVLHTAQQPAYAAALARLDVQIDTVVRPRLAAANARIDSGHLPRPAEFDLISGLTGLGAHLLHRRGGGDLLHDLLRYLVRFAMPLRVDGQTLPGWWCQGPPGGQPAARWPGGHGDLGCAHGITGPLVLLALSARRGLIVEGQADAIARICGGSTAGSRAPATRRGGPGRSRAPNSRPAPPASTAPSGRHGATAPPASPEPSSSPPSSSTIRIAGTQPSTHLPAASPTTGSWPYSSTPRCATAGPGSSAPSTGLQRMPARTARSPRTCPASTPSCTATCPSHGPPGQPGLLEGAAGVRLAQHAAVPATHWDACLLLND